MTQLKTGELAGSLSCRPPGLPGRIPSSRLSLEEFEETVTELVDLAGSDGTRVVLMTSVFRAEPGPRQGEAGQRLDAAQDCDGSYRSSLAQAAAGHCAEARQAFAAGRRLEPFRIQRDLARYNQVLRRIARERRLGLVDADALLKQGRDAALLLDPVHPSAAGHELIARALCEVVERLLARRA